MVSVVAVGGRWTEGVVMVEGWVEEEFGESWITPLRPWIVVVLQ